MPAVLTGDFDFTVVEGRTVAITPADLSSTGSSFDPSEILFELQNQPPAPGQPFAAFATSPGVAIESFTQADLDASLVVFTHGGAEATTATIEITVSDEEGTSPVQALAFTVTPANDGPVAAEESFNIDEDTVDTFDLFARPPGDEGLSGDDPDGDPVSVTDVIHDGVAIPVGVQTELASGALVTFNADGTVDFDANGAYDAITDSILEVFEFTVDDGLDDQTVDIGGPVSIENGGFTFTLDAETGLGRTDVAGAMIPTPVNGLQVTINQGVNSFSVSVTAFEFDEATLLVPTPFQLLNYTGGFTAVTPGITNVEDDVVNGTLIVEADVFTDTGTRTLSITIPAIDFADMQDGIVEIGENITGSISSQSSAQARFTINPVNDAPVIAEQASPDTGPEETQIALTDLTISDAEDDGNGEFEVQLSVDVGTITIDALEGLVVVDGANGSASITISGRLADINGALADTVFEPPFDFAGTVALDITVRDNQNGGSVGEDTGTQSRSIIVEPVNDEPFILRDSGRPLVVDEDQAIVLDGLIIDDRDVDPDVDIISLQISASDGSVTLADLSGAIVDNGANGSGNLTLNGTLSQLSDALNGLSFQGNQDFNGSAFVSLILDDLGNTGAPGPLTSTLEIALDVLAVNDAPLIFADAGTTFTAGAGVPLVLEGLSVDDPDFFGASGVLEVELSVLDGTLTLGTTDNLTIIEGADGSEAVLFSGELDSINAALAGLTYQGDGSSDSLRVVVDDLGSGDPQLPDNLVATETFDIFIEPLNTPPVIQANDGVSFVGQEDQNIAITGIAVDDAEASSFDADIVVEIGAEFGSLTVDASAGVIVGAIPQEPGSVTLTGRISDVNAALATLEYFAGDEINGAASLFILVSDEGNAGFPGALIATEEISVQIDAVNDLPVVDDAVFTTDEVTPVTDFLLGANGEPLFDADGDLVSIVSVDGQALAAGPLNLASGASVEVEANGRFVYNPNGVFDALTEGEVAADSFVFTASDGQGGEVQQVVELTINGIANRAQGLSFFGDDGSDRFVGGEGDDNIDTRGGDDFASGNGGNDIILVGDGNDYGRGGRDNDTISGGGGDDALFGDQGDDILRGGAGNDRSFGLAGNDILRGGAGNDVVAGGGGDDVAFGGVGNDKVRGGKGFDILSGGTGSDRLAGGRDDDFLSGDEGADRLRGGQGNDDLSGGRGTDVLKGGGGNDVLLGEEGADILTGGRGEDLFIFLANGGNDRVTDFTQGEDLLLVEGQTFGDLTFSDAAGGALLEYDGGTVVLLGIAADDISEQDFLLEPLIPGDGIFGP